MSVARAVLALSLCFVAGCEEEDSCFAGSTRVATPRGDRRIDELAVGDEVWTFDPDERRLAVGRVARVHRARGEIRSVVTAAGALRAVTASHPLYVEGRGFVRAEHVQIGESLRDRDGARTIVGFASPAPGDTVDVYTLTIEGAYPSFFADGFLAHNKSYAPVFDCEGQTANRFTLEAPLSLCTGETARVSATDTIAAYCPAGATGLVFATADPKVVVVDKDVAIGVGEGVTELILLHHGVEAARQRIEVTDCATDAGADAAKDDSASDAPSEVEPDAAAD